MPGDTNNANVWEDAVVYVSFNLDADLPASAADDMDDSDWTPVGLLDGEAGLPGTRTDQKTPHYAWGDLLIKTTRRNYVETKSFTALEDNATTWRLKNPGSTSGEIVVPRPEKIKVCFELRTGGRIRRRMCAFYAEAELQSTNENEQSVDALPFLVTIYPTTAGVLWIPQDTVNLTSIALLPLTLSLDASDGTIKQVVATATYDDASTADVTYLVKWASSAPAKATVDRGYVKAVAAGASNVTCSLDGVSSTAPCVVTVSA